jgi:hypothetical protein
MALPCGATGSLTPTFVPARLVGLAVNPPYVFTLDAWFPITLRGTSRASVTFWEATAPVKLPIRQCPPPGSRVQVSLPEHSGWYFNVGSIETGIPTSKPPTYPTQNIPSNNVKL